MEISFDEAKRAKTLKERGLDFNDAIEFFAQPYFEFQDDRQDYGEVRLVAIGTLGGRTISVVYTFRGLVRRIISMRHVHGREFEARRRTLD